MSENRAPVVRTIGRASDRGPGGAGVVVRADPGLVGEVDRGPLGLGLLADGRELLVLPPLHSLGILLVGPIQRPLRGQPMVRSSRPTLTTLSATLNSRRITWRTMSRVHSANSKQNWAGSEPTIQLVQPGDLRPGQLRRPTRHRLGRQRLPAALPELRQPPVHGLAVQPQRLRRHPPDARRPEPARPPAAAAPQGSGDPVSGLRSGGPSPVACSRSTNPWPARRRHSAICVGCTSNPRQPGDHLAKPGVRGPQLLDQRRQSLHAGRRRLGHQPTIATSWQAQVDTPTAAITSAHRPRRSARS